MDIKVGSRESKLAVVQSEMVIAAIKEYNPDINVELVTMKTTGDKILDRTLDKIGGKGLFVKELDKALADKRVDLTVHSFKDMPMEVNPELPILAVSKREDARDVLILPMGTDKLNLKKPIGCSSLRRKIQLEELYPDMVVKPVRGNVQTRLAKLDSGEFGALVLAYAGIKRLGLEKRISRIFDVTEILPASCQGILAVQGRCDFDRTVLSKFHSERSADIARAERSFVRYLDGGCSSPVASYAEIDGDSMILTGFYVDEKGVSYKKAIVGDRKKASELGIELARQMKERC